MAKPNVWLDYQRISVARNEHELIGVKDQHQVNVAEIQRRGGVVESYRDAGGHRSGRSAKSRPQWMAVLARLPDPDVAGIVATFQDRLSRDVGDTAELIKMCERLGKHLILPLDGVDTERSGWTPDTKLMLHIKASVAQHYADDVAKKLKRRVVHYHVDKGIPWGRLPFGMVRVGKGYDTRCVGSEQHAKSVVRILEWYSSGMSYDATMDRANATGLHFLTRGGLPCRFGRESIRTIVGNVLFYLGYLHQQGWDAKNDRIKIPEGPGSLLERHISASGARRVTTIEPIIDHDLAEAVIARRAANLNTGRKSKTRVFLLTPVARDAHTGRKLKGECKSSGNWYHSRGPGVWVKAEHAERQVLDRLKGIQFPPEAFGVIRSYLERKNGDEGRRQAQAALADTKARKGKLLQLLLDDKIDRDIYDGKYAELEAAERQAQAQLDKPTNVEQTLRALADLGSTIEMMSAPIQKRNLLRLFKSLDFNSEGELTGAQLNDWARSAFAELADLGANNAESGNPGQRWLLSDGIAWFVELSTMAANISR